MKIIFFLPLSFYAVPANDVNKDLLFMGRSIRKSGLHVKLNLHVSNPAKPEPKKDENFILKCILKAVFCVIPV